MFYSHQATFNNGEISPLLGSRSDLDFWQKSLRECVNFQVLLQGGIRRRSGTIFITEVANSAQPSRLLPFVFNADQAYVLDVNGGGTIRFVANRAYLVSGASPYAISHGWAAADLPRLNVAQANDVMYVAHPDYEPEKITRSGDIDWAIEDVLFKDGPYLSEETGGVTFVAAERGSATPFMSSNTTPSGTASSDTGSADAFRVFDGTDAEYVDAAKANGWVQYALPSAMVVDNYWVKASVSNPEQTPSQWLLQGSNDGVAFTTLDSRQSEVGFGNSEVRYYETNNEQAYLYYRFLWEATSSQSDSRIQEIGLHQKASDQTPYNLTASSASAINDGAGFQSSDNGRSIRLLGPDGRWRWAEIVTRTSTTNVQIRLHGHSMPNGGPFSRWQLGAFADTPGWPGAVTLYDERLMWARTNAQPLTIFGSKQSIFDDYGVSSPAVETDGITFTLLSSNMNEILWLADDEDLVSGSSQQIRSVGPADFTKAFSAINLTQKKGPTSGANYLQPITIGGVVLYVARGARKIRELVLGPQNRYVAPELSVLADHMLKSGVVDWSFSENPDPTIYCVTENGDLVAIAYDRNQEVVGFARHQIAGGHVESVAVIPGDEDGEDDVYMVVRRTINGATKRYIEVLEHAFDGDVDTIDDAFFVDCGLKYSGSAISTVTGLSHLEGEEVVALADGGVVTGLTVSGGQVTLPYAAESIAIGLAYNSRAVTLPVAGPQQDGSLFGRRMNIIQPMIDVLHSGSMMVGAYGSEDWTPETFEALEPRGDELFGNPVALVTGFKNAEIDGSWKDGDGSIVMETDKPLPLLIRSVVYQLESEP